MHNKNEGARANPFVTAMWAIVVIAAVKFFLPNTIPFGTWQFWETKGDIHAWLSAGWPMLAWGVILTVILSLVQMIAKRRHYRSYRFSPFSNHQPSGLAILIAGSLISLRAGIVEEVIFRWLIFLCTIAIIHIPNFLFFGWLDFGLVEWFHNNVWGPIANWITLDHLKPYLFHEYGWSVGAAVLWTTALFRDHHLYLGWIGYLNSWFLGLVLFWFMFQFGLPAAILMHVLYDFVIFATLAGLAELWSE